MKRPVGRPPRQISVGVGAARVQLDLSAAVEAALLALRLTWRDERGMAPSATVIKRAVLETAQRVAPDALQAMLAAGRGEVAGPK